MGSVLGVIPARWSSTRLPGKVLAPIAGRSMVEHVFRRARRALDRVVIATDDLRILDEARRFGAEAVLTRSDHRTGTERVAEVAAALPGDLILVLQADEPLLDPEHLVALVSAFGDPSVQVATLAAPLADPGPSSQVKVVVDHRGDALYFSRSAIPIGGPFLGHVGLYAYRREALLDFVSLEPSALERAEGLEQLRLLENGRKIRVVEVPEAGPSVDTQAELELVRRLMEVQR